MRAVLKAYSYVVQVYSKRYAKRWNFFPGKAQGLKNRHRKILLPSPTICAKPLCSLPGELECWPCHTSSQERVTAITAVHPAALCASAAGTETAWSPGLEEEQCRVSRAQKGLTLVGLGGTKNGQTNSLSRYCMRWQRADRETLAWDCPISHSYFCDVWGPLLLKPCQSIIWLRHKTRGGGSSRLLLLMFNVIKKLPPDTPS